MTSESHRDSPVDKLSNSGTGSWPLLGVPDYDEFNSRLVAGEPTYAPRLAPVPVRMPLPKAPRQGSIYETQSVFRNKYFEVTGEARKAGAT